MTGKDVDSPKPQLNAKDERDIEKIIEHTREQLLSQEGLMFDGDPASPEAVVLSLLLCRLEWKWQRKRTKKNIRLRNIKRTDAYVHKKTSFTTCQEIPDSRSF